MSLGSIARAILGERFFPVVGRYYRALFVDLNKVIDSFPAPAPAARVLDIGGGDGEVMKLYFERHPQARVTMCDLRKEIGQSLTADQRRQVELLPGTSIRDLAARGGHAPDIVILSDVVHHVPPAARDQFFSDLCALLAGRAAVLVIKDLEPGPLRATFAYLTDRFISGDPHVQQLGQAEMIRLVERAFPGCTCRRTELFERDPPNYSLVFTLPATANSQA